MCDDVDRYVAWVWCNSLMQYIRPIFGWQKCNSIIMQGLKDIWDMDSAHIELPEHGDEQVEHHDIGDERIDGEQDGHNPVVRWALFRLTLAQRRFETVGGTILSRLVLLYDARAQTPCKYTCYVAIKICINLFKCKWLYSYKYNQWSVQKLCWNTTHDFALISTIFNLFDRIVSKRNTLDSKNTTRWLRVWKSAYDCESHKWDDVIVQCLCHHVIKSPTHHAMKSISPCRAHWHKFHASIHFKLTT